MICTVRSLHNLHVWREAHEGQEVQYDNNNEQTECAEWSRTERVLSLLVNTNEKKQRTSEHERCI